MRNKASVLAAPRHRVVLCADDFGLTEGVSRGILELAHLGRISATSAMTNRPWWPRLASELKRVESTIAVGLHLNLTLGAPLGPMPRLAPSGVLPTNRELLTRALTRRLPIDEIASEIKRQLAAFTQALGRPPDFVDGHQHVHVLPGIREPLIEILKASGASPWLRDPADRVVAIAARRIAVPKALVIHALSRSFGGAVRRAGFETNEGFSGFSPFDPSLPAEQLFGGCFSRLGPHPIVMCHPGHVDAELRTLDPVVDSRAQEQAYLASDAFLDLLAEREIELVTAPAGV